jgi:cytochrome c553
MRIVLIAFFVAVTAATASAQGDIARGQQKAGDCVACHGPGGNSETPEWPKLAGLSEGYIVSQLRAYQKAERKDDLMAPMAQGLTEQDMQDLGAFFASQKMTIEAAGSDKALLDSGERVYRAGVPATKVTACLLCHGPAGAGHAPVGFTRLAGQHAPYVVAQLQAFKSGQRTDPDRMMKEVAERMTDDEMRAVAAFTASLASSGK